MNCLIDFIGLAGCGGTAPASSLFINSLPGISLKSIEQLADAEQKTYIGVWNDVQLRASKRIELALLAEVSKTNKVKTAKYQTSTHYPKVNANTILSGYPQVQFSTECTSPLQYHYFDSITFAENVSDLFYIAFINTDTTELYYETTFDTSSGDYTLKLNKKFYCQNITLEVRSDSGTYYYGEAKPIYHDCGSILFGKRISTFEQTDTLYGFDLSGYAVGCDLNNLACDNRDLLALPLWYTLGAELMMERMTSDRINKLTVDRKQAEELKAFYDNEADRALKLAFNGITMAECDCCLECDPPIAIKEARL